MGDFTGELGRKDIINCTIKADIVNPSMKDFLNAIVDIKIVT